MAEHLCANRLQQIIDTYFQLPIGYDPATRAVVLGPVSRQFVNFLPVLPAPMLQLRSDLHMLNRQDRLLDGSIPLLDWLSSVAALSAGTEQEKIFLAVADDLAHRLTGAPRLDPPRLPEYKEAIVHQDDMVSYSFMANGAAVSQSVAKIRVPRYDNGQPKKHADGPVIYLGTGWLLTESLLITNHHVINARNEDEPIAAEADLILQAKNAVVQFDYDADDMQGFTTPANALEAWAAKLDYAILRLAATRRKPLRVRSTSLEQHSGEYTPVNIVQHPGGESKKYAIRNNLVSAVTSTDIRYFTDTRAGSSGAPVLDDNWKVVALHRGSTFADGVKFQGRSTAWVNLGTSILAILEDLRSRYPVLFAECTAA
jgi:endonuclease G